MDMLMAFQILFNNMWLLVLYLVFSIKTYNTYKKLWKLLSGGLYLLLINLRMVLIYNLNRWLCLHMFSGISAIIIIYDGLLPISTEYWATSYLLGICIDKEITYRITDQ